MKGVAPSFFLPGIPVVYCNQIMARLSRFELLAFRLGERKSVRLQHPSSARKRLLLLGF